MDDKAEIPVLRRKVDARRAALGLSEMTPAKAMRLALAKAGDKLLHVLVAVRDLQQGSVAPDGLAQALPDPALILRLSGPDGAVALAVLCPQAVAAVTEAQTMGKVQAAPAPDRRPTATDASLVRDFVELGLAGFGALAADCRGMPPVAGYAQAGRVADARAAAMVLMDTAHLHLTAELDFAAGTKVGSLHLVLPTRAAAPGAAEDRQDWAGALEHAVMGSAVRLEAILCRIKLPLADVTGLEAGQVLPLGRAGLDAVTLRATNGRKVMGARLGRSGAMRAVRLLTGNGPAAATAPRTALGSLSPQPAGGGSSSKPPSRPQPKAAAPKPAAPKADLPDFPDLPDAGGLADLPGAAIAEPASMDAVPMPVPMDLPE